MDDTLDLLTLCLKVKGAVVAEQVFTIEVVSGTAAVVDRRVVYDLFVTSLDTIQKMNFGRLLK